jgi:hypothetical protein
MGDVQLVPEGKLTAENLYQLSEHFGTAERQYLKVDPKYRGGQGTQVPFLVQWKEDDEYYKPRFIFFYAYNGPFDVCGKEYGAHGGDVEHATFQINKKTLELEWVYCSARYRSRLGRRPSRAVFRQSLSRHVLESRHLVSNLWDG